MFGLEPLHLILFAAFAAVVAGVWLMMDSASSRKSRAEERLEQIGRKRQSKQIVDRETNAMSRMIERATPALSAPLQPKTEKDKRKLKVRWANAGFRGEGAASIFLSMKLIGLIIGGIVGGVYSLVAGGFDINTLIKGVGCVCLFFFIPEIILMFLIRRRKQAIFLGLPDALDLMVVCVEAGLGLDQAMRKVSEEMKKSYVVIAEEFGLCNLQLQMGKTRAEVLQELGIRSGVDDLRALASILIQADKFGSSIAQALRVQSDAMRTRRQQIAEEKAAKTAVKLIFPLVLFIFPGIFVVLVGPAAITMVREMFPALNG
ncbi:MAG: type II secretion system F family protein [Pirellulaceae bacterium]